MSWEQQAYSFGNPNAQPPTPTRTPTSLVFPSPTFETPRVNNNAFDNRSGWTPIFAEEYSVFNDSPQQPFVETLTLTPRPSTSSSQRRPLSSTEDLAVELASHVHHLSPLTNLPLPPVDSSRQLSSSPGPGPAHGGRFEETNIKVTPRRPKRPVEGSLSGQTATPPQSASKETRRLAPKLDVRTMQRNQDSFLPPSGTPAQLNTVNFTSMDPGDMFSYPMSAPATAPVYTNSRPFWDPDSTMMSMDIDFSADPSMFDTPSSHRLANTVDWGRNNEVFQETTSAPLFAPEPAQPTRRQRPLLAKPPAPNLEQSSTSLTFDFGRATMSEDPFSNGAVDPGLLFSVPQINTTSAPPASFDSTTAAPLSRPTSGHLLREPYQHQLRESRRDEEELRRSRSARDSTTASRFDRPLSNPAAKGIRPGLQRSFSDSRTRRHQSQKPTLLPSTGRKSGIADFRGATAKVATSPLKHQSHTSLASIPEAAGPNARTAITFSIDANGRARTETTVIVDKQMTARGGPQIVDDGWSSPRSSSSTDDDPITIPSKRVSFTAQDTRSTKFLHSEISSQSVEGSRRGSFTGKSSSMDDEESEAETIIEDDDGSGDATNALRKVVESRKQVSSQQPGIRLHLQPKDSAQRFYGQPNPHSLQQYGNQQSSSNISPTTVTDPDLATPSTDRGSSRSDSTRCVCNSREGDSFMIQCESCEKWLHASCVGVNRQRLPKVYICAFCAQTPNMRGGRIRDPVRANAQLGSSPLAHKSFQSWR